MSAFRLAVLASVALGGVAAFGTQASAVPMKAVWTGTVSNSYDGTNDFGAGVGGGVLDGLTFTATYIFDPATPGASRTTNFAYDQVLGGLGYGPVNSPMQSAVLTINGHSNTVNGGYAGNAINYGSSYTYQLAQDYSVSGAGVVSNFIQNYGYNSLITADLNATFAFSSLNFPYGYFQFYSTDASNNILHYSYGSITGSSVVVSQVNAVPLPAALPLLMAGLGSLGVAMRRRKKKAA